MRASFRLPIKGQKALAGKSGALQVLCVNTRDRRSMRAWSEYKWWRKCKEDVVQVRVIRFAFYAFHSFLVEVETNAGCDGRSKHARVWPEYKWWRKCKEDVVHARDQICLLCFPFILTGSRNECWLLHVPNMRYPPDESPPRAITALVTIQWISVRETNSVIFWIVIYPLN